MKKLIFIIFLPSCSLFFDPDVYIQPELKPYVDSFVAEGIKRGKTFNIDNIIIEIRDGITAEYGGLAVTKRGSKDRMQVILYVDSEYYENNIGTDCLEQTMYHELGHAILKRSHTVEYSIMNNRIPRCWRSGGKDCLLDELFGVNKVSVYKCING